MRDLSSVDDPNGEAIQQVMPKRPEKQLIDEIDKIATLHVKTASGMERDVKVLATCSDQGPVSM